MSINLVLWTSGLHLLLVVVSPLPWGVGPSAGGSRGCPPHWRMFREKTLCEQGAHWEGGGSQGCVAFLGEKKVVKFLRWNLW